MGLTVNQGRINTSDVLAIESIQNKTQGGEKKLKKRTKQEKIPLNCGAISSNQIYL